MPDLNALLSQAVQSESIQLAIAKRLEAERAAAAAKKAAEERIAAADAAKKAAEERAAAAAKKAAELAAKSAVSTKESELADAKSNEKTNSSEQSKKEAEERAAKAAASAERAAELAARSAVSTKESDAANAFKHEKAIAYVSSWSLEKRTENVKSLVETYLNAYLNDTASSFFKPNQARRTTIEKLKDAIKDREVSADAMREHVVAAKQSTLSSQSTFFGLRSSRLAEQLTKCIELIDELPPASAYKP